MGNLHLKWALTYSVKLNMDKFKHGQEEQDLSFVYCNKKIDFYLQVRNFFLKIGFKTGGMPALNIFSYYALGNHLIKFYYGLYADSTKKKIFLENFKKKKKKKKKKK